MDAALVAAAPAPPLVHTLTTQQHAHDSSPSTSSSSGPSSVLALAVSAPSSSSTTDNAPLIFSSTSSSESIHVFSSRTYLPHPTRPQLHGHTSSILALEVAPSPRNWLFSASADGTVRIWDTETLECLYVILVQGDDEEDSTVGDVFALKWQKETETLFVGCQNTSLRWCCLAKLPHRSKRARRAAAKAAVAATSAQATPQQRRDDADETESAASTIDATEDTPSYFTSGSSSAIPIPAPQSRPPQRPHKFFDSDALRSKSPQLSSSFPSSNGWAGPPSPGRSTPPRLARHSSHQGAPIPPTVAPTAPMPETLAAPPSDAAAAADEGQAHQPRYMQLGPSCVLPNAHYGYIYALALTSSPSLSSSSSSLTPPLLASGSGDEDVKLWACPSSSSSSPSSPSPTTLELVSTLSGTSTTAGGAVLSLATWGQTTLFAGKQGGGIDVWDLDTRALLRTLEGGHDDDVLCLVALQGDEDEAIGGGAGGATLISAGADGRVCRWDAGFALVQRWTVAEAPQQQHQKGSDTAASIQSCTVLPAEASSDVGLRLLTGGSDGLISVWQLPSPHATQDEGSATPAIKRVGFELGTTVDSVAQAGSSIDSSSSSTSTSTTTTLTGRAAPRTLSHDTLLTSLSSFIAFRSVSSSSHPSVAAYHREESRQCAYWLKAHLSSLGASQAQILPGAKGRNPLVLASWEARRGSTAGGSVDMGSSSYGSSASSSYSSSSTTTPSRRKRILFYGHYDVIGAPTSGEGWRTPSPWHLTGLDGYLYGRGVSDDKGPILSVASAVHRLHSRRQLDVDVVMLIEGEEESGSVGFRDCLERHRDVLGRVDVVLLSNSYWLDETTPCVTMGMRGVIKASVTVSKPTTKRGHGAGSRCDVGDNHGFYGSGDGIDGGGSGDGDDVHSGVQGGSLREPMIDLVRLLAHLSDEGQRVKVPGFYDDVRPLSDKEKREYEEIVQVLKGNAEREGGAGAGGGGGAGGAAPSVETLMARWRYPSLSLHGITSSAPTTVPTTTTATSDTPSSSVDPAYKTPAASSPAPATSSSSAGHSGAIIPARATAHLSLRLVPNQELSAVRRDLEKFLHDKFNAAQQGYDNRLGSNVLTVEVGHEAGWWVGDAASSYTAALKDSIRQAWSDSPAPTNPSTTPSSSTRLPLSIREGGSIPAVSILESFFDAPAVHLPMGQASDSAHLADERIRLLNLVKGREIVEGFLGRCARLEG